VTTALGNALLEELIVARKRGSHCTLHVQTSARDPRPGVHTTVLSTGEAAAPTALHCLQESRAVTSANPDPSVAGESRSGIGSGLTRVGVHGANVTLDHTMACSPAVARSGGRFGLMSTTTPASTGHASSNGCCTWD
jgi:hypothetical protein